jgi:hypothetical protein
MTRKSILSGAVVLFILALPLVLSTCDMPMGLGDPIDWEPPVLTLDGPTTRYVRYGTTLTGTITDNGKVDRVILRDTITNTELFRARLLPNNRWEIALNFDESRNGDKILGELVGYDSFGNSGDSSIKGITLNVDLRPPFVEDIWISRTEVRRAFLEKIEDLRDLKTSDPHGEWPSSVNMYQNGSFWIDARIAELETTIEQIKLFIYDESKPDIPIFSGGIERITGTTIYNPRFLLNEADILADAEKIWPGYTAGYNNGERYYYRVEIQADDSAKNRNFPLVDQLDYFCMWKTADMPKGVLDPIVGTTDPITIPKGSTLPVQFFDDDVLKFAYAALFTKDQWNGTGDTGYIAPGVRIPNGTNDYKFDFLTKRLLENDPINYPVYNWKYDRPAPNAEHTRDLIPENGIDDMPYYVQVGQSDDDYGDYVLFTLVGDRKLPPHNTSDESLNLSKARIWNVSVVDENAPLIIFDKTADCPEENTFPEKLLDGKYFNIVGYTLRENRSGMNRVEKFRMAWIPFGMPDGADKYIEDVRKALIAGAGFPEGVQWWELKLELFNGPDALPGGNVEIGSGDVKMIYRQQIFSKRFNIQGDEADDPTGTNTEINDTSDYKNFTYKDELENTTKLFIFYAVDNMGHEVFSQRYLLGNRTPPTLQVYDITGRTGLESLEPPNIYKTVEEVAGSGGTITDAVRRAYQVELDGYNKSETPVNVRSIIENAVRSGNTSTLTASDLAATLQAYPRETVISYFVTAGQAAGGLEVKNITMEDVTSQISNENNRLVGFYKPYDLITETIGETIVQRPDPRSGLSYTEFLPEVDQRTFRFTATDALGNTNSIQRTVVISAAALLSEITTKVPSGTYGIGKDIVLQARFSGQIKWTGSQPPMLNVRYKNTQGGITSLQVLQIRTTTLPNTATQFLDFPIKVALNDGDKLETLYKGIGGVTNGITYPLTLPSGTQILDADRDEYPAFIPGYSVGFEWLDDKGSLQFTKNITLDGTPPQVAGPITISGKAANADGNIYFKRDEAIEFTLPANDNIFTGGDGNPRLAFRVGTSTTDRFANWVRSANSGHSMVFSAVVASEWGDGSITNIRLNTVSGTIVDDVGNPLASQDNMTVPANALTHSGTIIIDQTPPPAPASITVAGNAPSTAITNNYNGNPALVIPPAPPLASEPNGVARTEYSLNNGLKWVTYPNAESGWTGTSGGNLTIGPGEWIMRTRYVDKAGNEGTQTMHTLSVNSTFPQLRSISAAEPNGRYKQGATLNFTLSFSAPVWTATPAAVRITLSNRTNTYSDNATEPDYQYTLSAPTVAGSAATATSSISFAWTSITGKEMLDGLYVSRVEFTALRDIYTNPGFNGSATNADSHQLTINNTGGNTYTCANLSAGLIVDCIAPTLATTNPMTPVNAEGRVNDNRATSVMSAANNVITLRFREPVQRGSGTITIKPHGTYFIPPVFENDTYYLRVSDGDRRSTPSTGYTKIAGFYDIYNNSALNATDRTALTEGTNMTNGLTLDTRTGQAAGPYIRMTHGLKQGAGYSGNYNNNTNTDEFRSATVNGTANTPVGPNTTGTTYMIPDTATKWVLDYRYSINNGRNLNYVNTSDVSTAPSTTAVTEIRRVLTKAKYRWQEIDVTNTTVIAISGSTVTITLPEPLEKGLEWDICYPAGTFRDLAGNNDATGLNYTGGNIAGNITGNIGNTWFLSSGVQTPVIRVNRKSYDARTSNWNGPMTRNDNEGRYGTPANHSIPGGWGINDFNTVHFRIETETPYATLSYGLIDGRQSLGAGNVPIGSAYITDGTGTWDVDVPGGGTAANTTGFAWNNNTNTTRGTWVRPNLIRRAANNATAFWAVVENGITSQRVFKGDDGAHYGFRSYNRDATYATLNGLGLGTAITGPVSDGMGNFTYYPTEARKDYVVAQASVNNGTGATASSDRGYEGVFRSVVAMYQTNNTQSLVVEGSNVKNGMPSIAGFPVRDAEETGDTRFVKLFYRMGTTSQFYWVSTEIVSQWYFIKFGNGGSHQRSGDVNNYLSAGYGDLSYAYRAASY